MNFESVKVSRGERIVLQMLEKKYRWIARDKIGNLYVYEKKPTKEREIECWFGVVCGPLNLIAFNHHFQFIKWSDEEPWLITDIINKCGVKFE
jgi:hypothetical protein